MRVHSTRMDNAAVLVNVHGPMVQFTKASGRITSEMETANTLATNMSMLDSGLKI